MFTNFKAAVAKQFARMQKHAMFRTNTDKDALYGLYLSSFPEGSNPLFRTRTEHDCSCCKSFIRSVGNAVAIIDGKLETIWNVKVPGEPAYQVVTDAMAKYVRSMPITDVFFHFEKTAGTDKNFEQLLSGETQQWNHFFANIEPRFVKKGADIPSALAVPRDAAQVFGRALNELSLESIDTVLELIAQGSLYRGEEHKFVLTEFRKLHVAYAKLGTKEEKELFIWSNIGSIAGSVTGIRNTVIGSLLIDLSKGDDLDAAVRSFEAKVAPANYKRPTALVTPAMIKKAKEQLEELGLTSAMQRRHANLRDITVNNILFANRNATKAMTGDVFDDLIASAKPNLKSLGKIEEVSIERFMAEILPKAQSLEVLLENRHTANLVSLIAPVDATAGQLFKWDNGFSWAYNGSLADSDMRQAVAAKGGRVDGVFRFTHQWNYGKRNASLMDLHVFMPGNGMSTHDGKDDQYGNETRVGWNHRNHHASGGTQDVDYTAAAPEGYVPVENITFPDINRMPEGRYVCKIHNWSLRSPTQGGFKAEIEFGGQVFEYEYDKPMANKEWKTVAVVTLKNKQFTIEHHIPPAATSKAVWGLTSQTLQPVGLMLLSPNHWNDTPVGNKHFFFMLEGAKAEQPARGFFNEFLKDELTPHRKVFEIVGSKMKVEGTDDQLSGLGFSSTQRNDLVVKVGGAFNRTIKIVF